jgi:hypothetical protein
MVRPYKKDPRASPPGQLAQPSSTLIAAQQIDGRNGRPLAPAQASSQSQLEQDGDAWAELVCERYFE